MAIYPHTIYPAVGSRPKRKRVGRGNCSQKGTMSGKGGKGQTARAGGRRRCTLRALRPTILKIPKLRGFKSPIPRLEVVTLSQLEAVAGAQTITPIILHEKGIIKHPENGVKIVSTGKLTKKVVLEGCVASKGAIAVIEKAGGKVTF